MVGWLEINDLFLKITRLLVSFSKVSLFQEGFLALSDSYSLSDFLLQLIAFYPTLNR